MDTDFSDNFLIKRKFSIKKAKTKYTGKLTRKEGEKMLAEQKNQLYELQNLLYADGSFSLLIIIQAMDAAGKDSLIEHVFGGVNPQGCEVTSFKQPSEKDYSHDFLWRHYVSLPPKGKIGIYNRSHYESVLVCKVHPNYNLAEKVWDSPKDFNDKFWSDRYESIRDFEKHLSRNGTKIVKLFLNVSKDVQKKRFIDRIDQQEKNWKFSLGDMKEREFWDEYMKAYEDAINQTTAECAPWYVLPADDKWFARIAALQIIIDNLKKIKMHYPQISREEADALAAARKSLEGEK